MHTVHMSKLAGLTALLLAAAFLVACGSGSGVDANKAEQSIQQTLGPRIEGQLHHSISSVSCPDGVDAKAGEKFTCTLTTDNGATVNVNATVLDDQAAHVQFVLANDAEGKISRGG